MNRSLSPGDHGHRTSDPRRESGRARIVPGLAELVSGTAANRERTAAARTSVGGFARLRRRISSALTGDPCS
jgi:hypothetical protein